MTAVAVVGSTGSIGTQTLEVVRAEPGRYDVVALGAGGANLDLLVAQAEEHRPKVVAVADEAAGAELTRRLPWCEVRVGGEGADSAFASLCESADVVVNGVVGFAGLPVTLATLAAGRRLALANKESLIAAGPLVARVRDTPGAEILPVDSEHCALHQCLRAGNDREVAALVLTASGGPFRGRSRADLAAVTVEDALAHPTWKMGPKVTVDSSTLMNKGLEVIEAHELYGTPYAAIDVVVHPQSVVHSMVTFSDGATIAQMSMPDMRLPIAYALAYPDRSTVPVGLVDWAEVGSLDFEAPDREAFPCLDLAFAAGQVGGSAPAWLNAANEVAVEAFLAGRLSWTSIPDVLKECLDRHDGTVMDDVGVVIEIDHRARELARGVIERRAGS
ncbi:MAG: 1-deoxy-D-xylulose-5-phosphate reductoisomerase [Acidimicrobiales bacterium]